jgi:hypothetical protein
MRNLVRKFFFGFIVAAALFGLGYTLGLYAHHSIDGLEGLLSMKISVLAVLWFGFHLNEEAEDWPLSIRHTARAATPRIERHSGWKLEQNAA